MVTFYCKGRQSNISDVIVELQAVISGFKYERFSATEANFSCDDDEADRFRDKLENHGLEVEMT